MTTKTLNEQTEVLNDIDARLKTIISTMEGMAAGVSANNAATKELHANAEGIKSLAAALKDLNSSVTAENVSKLKSRMEEKQKSAKGIIDDVGNTIGSGFVEHPYVATGVVVLATLAGQRYVWPTVSGMWSGNNDNAESNVRRVRSA